MGLELTIYKNFITPSERLELLDHAYSMELNVNHDMVSPYGTRRYKRIDGTKLANSLVNKIFKRIVTKLQLEDPVIDPSLGQLVSVIKPGGRIHPHTDVYMKPGFTHYNNLRFNIMVERGEDSSYNPVIEGQGYGIHKRDAWCFNATKHIHETEIIKGPEARVVYQFGFMV